MSKKNKHLEPKKKTHIQLRVEKYKKNHSKITMKASKTIDNLNQEILEAGNALINFDKNLDSKNMEIAISANKFLDILQSVVPAASSDTTRPHICTVKLEVLAEEYAIKAIATNGFIISVAQRNLGFSDEQEDLEDLQARNDLKDSSYLISKTDAELLILSLKKLGVRRGAEDKTGGRYYIAIRERENKLSISILGLSHVVLEPTLIKEEFPDYEYLIPRDNDNSNSSYLNLKLVTLSLLGKCWGLNEKVIIAFFGQRIKITREITIQEDYQEKDKDFIMMLSGIIEEKEETKQSDFAFPTENN